MDNKEPAPQELHGEGLAPNTPSAAPIPAAAAPDPALCCGKFVACENIYCVWKIQALRKPAAPSGVVVPREPTIIKAFPGQAVEEYRQQHGGFLPAEAEKWDTLLGKLPTDGTPQNKELTIAGNLVRQVILDFKRAMLAAAPSQSAPAEGNAELRQSLQGLLDASDGAASGYVEMSDSDEKWTHKLEAARERAIDALARSGERKESK